MCVWSRGVGPEGEGRRHSQPSWESHGERIPQRGHFPRPIPSGTELIQTEGVDRFLAPQGRSRSAVRVCRARDEDASVENRLSPATQTIHDSLLPGLHSLAGLSPRTDSPPRTTSKPGAVSRARAPGSLEASLRLWSPPSAPALLPPRGSSG